MVISTEPSRGCRATVIVPLGKPSPLNEARRLRKPVRIRGPEPSPPMDRPDPQAGQKIRALLVDDHTVVRQGLAQLLARIPACRLWAKPRMARWPCE